jgi:hypothetical protein
MPEINRLFVITFITMLVALASSIVSLYAMRTDKDKCLIHFITAGLALYYCVICLLMLLDVLNISTAGSIWLRPADATTYLFIMIHAISDIWLRRNKR